MAWRYALAIFLSMIVYFGWLALFPMPKRAAPPATPQPAAAPGQPQPKVEQHAAGEHAAEQPAAVQAQASPAEKPALPQRERKEIALALDNRFRFVADSRGGCLASVALSEYHESVADKSPYTLLKAPGEGAGVFTLEVEDTNNPAKPSRIPFEANWDVERTSAEGAPPVVVFKYDLDSVSITKTVTQGGPEFPGEGADEAVPRHLKVTIELQNQGTAPVDLVYRLFGPVGVDTEDMQKPGNDIELAAGIWSKDKVNAEVLSSVKVTHKDLSTGGLAWIGLSNNYFTGILFPLPVEAGRQAPFVDKAFADSYPDESSLKTLAEETYKRPLEALAAVEVATLREKAYKNLRVAFRSTKLTLKPGEPVRHEYGLYMGPRDKKLLARYEPLNLNAVNYYGMWGFVVTFFIWLLGILKIAAFGSWGVAIMLLTFIVKLCLHPINKSTQRSMQRFQKQMQRIKPQMDELKEKFAGNRQRMNAEMQKLWRENHINPGQQMAGCLIMFLQLPIWIGLYTTLRYALGLRQASFLYIQDLTKPDMLFNFGSRVPLFGEWFNLLPVLYVILTIVNQRMQPKPDDPQMRQQYNMMTFMMVFFGYIFYSFPAGFMLYIMTSAALGIIESKIIKAELRHEEGASGAALAGATPGTSPGGAAMYPARSRKAEEERAKRGGRR